MDLTKKALMGSTSADEAEGKKSKPFDNCFRVDYEDEGDEGDSDDDGIDVEQSEESNSGNWKGNENVLKNRFDRKIEYFENGGEKVGTSNLINFKNKMLDNIDEYVEEEGRYFHKFSHNVRGVRKVTRVLISKDKFDSESKPKTKLSIMPPPPSPAWRKGTTPKRDNFLKSPSTELFADENLTECQAVPSNLFSPMRQVELAGGRVPRYQEIPLDYPQPRSVDSANLDWFSSIGGPNTPGRPATPGYPATPGRPATPGLPATPGRPATPGHPATHGHSTTPGHPATHGHSTTPSSLRTVTPSTLITPGPSSRPPATSSSATIAYADQGASIETPIAKGIIKDMDVLAKNVEKDKKLKSDIFKKMNNLLNEETVHSEVFKQTKKKVLKPSENVRIVRAGVKTSPNSSVGIVSRGSWRFSSEHSSEPFVPVVKVRNDSLTRPLVLSKAYDFYQPIVKAIVKKDEKRKHALKDENVGVISKKQKLEEASETLLPMSRKVNYLCKDCGKRCSCLRDVKAHLCFPKVQCEDCKPTIKNFQNRKLLLQHLSHSHPAVGQRFACQYCEKGAANKTYLRDHVKKFHPLEFIEIYEEVTFVGLNDATSEIVEKDNENNAESDPKSPRDLMDDIVACHEAVAEDLAVESVVTCEEDIDAPDSVVSTSHEADVVESTPQPFSYHCDKCKKGFHTSMRYKNHRKNCGGQKKVTIEDRLVRNNARQPMRLKRRNARFEQLKTNWSELLEGRERCGKCGRNNYSQDDLEKHKRVCKGTLLDSHSKYICPHCTQPSRIFNTENAMRRHVSTNHAKEAMEDEWDYEHVEEECEGLAKNHFFR